MKKFLFSALLLFCTLTFESCEWGSVEDSHPEYYTIYKFTDPDDAQYVFVSLSNRAEPDNCPTIYTWNLLKEEVFDDVIKGNFSLPLSNGYHLNKYICSDKTTHWNDNSYRTNYHSSIKWSDLSELKVNKYAFGDRYVWCGENDSILCGIDEWDDYEHVWKWWSTLDSYTTRIILADSFNIERNHNVIEHHLRQDWIDNLFISTYGYQSTTRIIPFYYFNRIANYGDEEDIKCYPFTKPSYLCTPEERDSIRSNPFYKKAKDIRADYVKLLNQIIENNELDKYKI